MSVSVQQLKLAINPDLIEKNEAGNASLFATGWRNQEVTIEEFTAAIQRGEAYCAQLKGPRKASNFLACNISSVDIDHGLTIEQALANLFIRRHAHIIYTTGRHTQEAHRFRIVFVLPETIVSAQRMRSINRGLTRRLGGDMAATDAARISYGNRAAKVHHIGGSIDPELLRELIADAALPENTALPEREIVSSRSFVTLALDQELRLADGGHISLRDASVTTRVHCPVHPDENASAFVLQNRHGEAGVYCSACSKTYWPGKQPRDTYDPDDFVDTARAIAAATELTSPTDAGWSIHSFLGDERLANRRVHIVQGQAAPNELPPGITLVRSDKGTGKTEAMKRLSRGVKSVLLIGHRRTLIRGSCKRLGLACYLDKNRTQAHGRAASGATLNAFLSEDGDES
jgi:hypothetical protein